MAASLNENLSDLTGKGVLITVPAWVTRSSGCCFEKARLCILLYVSPLIFTKLFVTLFKETAQTPGSDVRTVNMSSNVHKLIGRAQFQTSGEDLGPGIFVVCLYPGSIVTEGALDNMGRDPWTISTLLQWNMRKGFLGLSQAATLVLVAATQPEKEKYHCSYLMLFGKLANTCKVAADEGLARDLWALTKNILADEGL
ncbi:hypothetical protein ACEPAH_8436 [Sanghuangporus vaninii]